MNICCMLIGFGRIHKAPPDHFSSLINIREGISKEQRNTNPVKRVLKDCTHDGMLDRQHDSISCSQKKICVSRPLQRHECSRCEGSRCEGSRSKGGRCEGGRCEGSMCEWGRCEGSMCEWGRHEDSRCEWGRCEYTRWFAPTNRLLGQNSHVITWSDRSDITQR